MSKFSSDNCPNTDWYNRNINVLGGVTWQNIVEGAIRLAKTGARQAVAPPVAPPPSLPLLVDNPYPEEVEEYDDGHQGMEEGDYYEE